MEERCGGFYISFSRRAILTGLAAAFGTSACGPSDPNPHKVAMASQGQDDANPRPPEKSSTITPDLKSNVQAAKDKLLASAIYGKTANYNQERRQITPTEAPEILRVIGYFSAGNTIGAAVFREDVSNLDGDFKEVPLDKANRHVQYVVRVIGVPYGSSSTTGVDNARIQDYPYALFGVFFAPVGITQKDGQTSYYFTDPLTGQPLPDGKMLASSGNFLRVANQPAFNAATKGVPPVSTPSPSVISK